MTQFLIIRIGILTFCPFTYLIFVLHNKIQHTASIEIMDKFIIEIGILG